MVPVSEVFVRFVMLADIEVLTEQALSSLSDQVVVQPWVLLVMGVMRSVVIPNEAFNVLRSISTFLTGCPSAKLNCLVSLEQLNPRVKAKRL